MSRVFPKDCCENCPSFRRWDLSIDDYTNVCYKLKVQVDDMDAYGPMYLPLECPLSDKEFEEIRKSN